MYLCTQNIIMITINHHEIIKENNYHKYGKREILKLSTLHQSDPWTD
jgi:hypothetical protein